MSVTLRFSPRVMLLPSFVCILPVFFLFFLIFIFASPALFTIIRRSSLPFRPQTPFFLSLCICVLARIFNLYIYTGVRPNVALRKPCVPTFCVEKKKKEKCVKRNKRACKLVVAHPNASTVCRNVLLGYIRFFSFLISLTQPSSPFLFFTLGVFLFPRIIFLSLIVVLLEFLYKYVRVNP